MPTISIYLPDDDNAKLDRMAADENRSVSNMVATIVKQEYVRRYVVESVKNLPHPDGAAVIPVVTIRAQG